MKLHHKNIQMINELNISEILRDYPSEYGTFNIFHKLNHLIDLINYFSKFLQDIL